MIEGKQKIKEITNIVIETLKEHNLLSKSKDGYGNTKKLLFNIDKLKASIIDSKSEIKNLNKYGIQKTAKAVKTIVKEFEDEDIKIANRINSLRQSIHITESTLQRVNLILSDLSIEESMIIKLYFFEKVKQEDMVEELAKDGIYMEQYTISKKINKLINEKIKIRLFPNEFIEELGY